MGTNDPKLERLKAINEDKPPEGSEAGWIARIHGDTQVFNGTGDDAATSSYAVCSLRNLSWPGWLTASTVYPQLLRIDHLPQSTSDTA